MIIELNLPYLPPKELSPNWQPFTRGGLYAKQAARKRMGEDVYWLTYHTLAERQEKLSDLPWPALRLTYTFIVPNRRARDADNWIGRMKVAQDALVKVGLVSDDTHDLVEVAPPVFWLEKGRAETIISIERRVV